MGTTHNWNERTLFNGAKNIVGSLELDGFLNIDNSPGSEKSSATPADWTAGTNWAFAGTVCTHTAGATATLSLDASEVANEIYRVVFPVAARTAGSVTVSIGGVSGTARSSNTTFTEFITATGTGNLTFTPSSDFDGNVDIASVSVKRVGVAAADRVTAWVGDRIASGVEAAGDAGLFLRSEDGTQHFLGDTSQIGGALLINGTSAYSDNATLLQVNKSGAGGLSLFCWSTTDSDQSYLEFHKSADATVGTKALVANGEALGGILWRAADSADGWSSVASIVGYIDATPGDNDTAGRLVFSTTADGAATPTERLRIDSAGRVLINGTAAYADNGQLLEVNKSADDGGIGLFCWSATDAERALLEFHKSASATIGTKALVADEEALGGIIWKAADGATNWQPAASIEGFVDTTPGAGDMGGRLVFSTTADGAASVTERLRITSSGALLINASAAYGRLGQLLEVNTSANYGGGALSTWSTTAAEGALLDINRSKSATIGTHAIVSNNDVIGMLNWRASDGVSFMDGARIVAEIDGTPGENDMPTRLVVMTTPDGSATLIERVRIDSAGYMGLGTAASAATLFEAAEVKTITGAVTDGYSGGLTLNPGYTAATALTVTRHNYIDVNDVSNAGAGPSAVTDACVLRFDAAAGTHKATVGATTKTTPSGVDGWMKVNVNGTIYYMPMYTSTTA